jgi:hypothetical protein
MLNESISIIKAVTNPLSFFVLVVLIVEAIFGIVAVKFEKQRGLIVVAMITLIFLLVGIVAALAYYRPEALKGGRYIEDPEIIQMRNNFREIEQLADKITGDWSFVTHYQHEGQPLPVEIKGICNIRKGKYGIAMNGSCIGPDEKQHTPFNVKQVFLSETGLTYIYEVPKCLGENILGVGQLMFIPVEGESPIKRMVGNWAVLGSELTGKAEFYR